ncbi:hypothetical protein UA45_17340 [Morganella morganii]|uniref:Uncharacterized protein n=1 Tax=Morganella morganii TaxID=582 RepID=A0A0D8L454_MORMO|nr:hypothetical protein UA45_17340 [Morganella morganii]
MVKPLFCKKVISSGYRPEKVLRMHQYLTVFQSEEKQLHYKKGLLYRLCMIDRRACCTRSLSLFQIELMMNSETKNP